jgi:sulfur-oxidizing protein SoxY
MNKHRRDLMQAGAGLGVLVAAASLPLRAAAQQAPAWNKAAFEAKSVQDVVKSLGGSAAKESAEITITAPDIAEHGAVVPVGVVSKVPGTQGVWILVDKNPNALAAGFTIPQGTEANVSTRLKMGQTSNVMALVKANNQFFIATKEVKVTLGGCGG